MNDNRRGERWRRVEELYHAAVDLPASDRAAFLKNNCGSDAALHGEVEALLSVAKAAEGFLEPGVQASNEAAPITGGALEGRQVGPYAIRELIGAGGMGEVYRATDTRLGRDVAMKVLRDAFSADRLRRFEQEARAAAALNHPNIVAVFDVGVAEGVSYLISELLEGETLRRVVNRGRLPIRQAIDYAVQMASGLAAAHDKGIVHRDLKPENIFITTEGRLKILDFGVAKLIEGAGPLAPLLAARQGSTAPATIVGTIGYMSPEQIRGEPVDHRSDIFSFGAVLHEMVTNQRAFQGDTAAETLTSILKDEPSHAGLADTPALVRALQVARRCLEKSPQTRFQSCRDLALVLSDDLTATEPFTRSRSTRPRDIVVALAALFACIALGTWAVSRFRPPAGSAHIRSLAVLPFESVSHGPDDAYVADGITGALTTNLAQISALRVVSRTSVMRYKQSRPPLPQIGRELNVDAVLEGTIDRVGDRIRINVQLIRAATDEHLWAETYDRNLRDVLLLQDDVARSVARQVRATLTPGEHERLAGSRAVDADAYLAYVKGRFFWDRRTDESIKRAVSYFMQAIERAPDYAAAYSGLADCYLSLGISFDVGSMPPNQAMPAAKAAVTKALALDDSLAEAHNSLAYAKLIYDWDWPGAEAEFKRSLELNPGYAQAHHWYSHFLVSSARFDEALAESQRALELDPVSPIINVHLGWNYIFTRQSDKAVAQLAKSIELDPNYGLAYWYRGLAYEQQTRYAEALKDMAKGAALLKGNVVVEADMGHVYGVSSQRGEAERIIGELEQESTRRFVSSFEMALTQVGLGRTDRAFAWLDKAYRERSDLLVYLRVDPRLDPIRGDRRFADLVERVGSPK